MKYRSLILLSLVSIFLFSCIEEVQWETENYEELLVVEGSFTDEYKKHKIRLTKTAEYFSNEQTPAVSGAEVSITGNNKTIYFESSDEPGVYVTEKPVAGTPGNTYTLDVYLQEPLNNKKHYTATEKMKPGVELSSIKPVLYENPMYSEESPNMDSLLVDVSLFWKKSPVKNNYYRIQLYLKNTKNRKINSFYVFKGDEELKGEYVSNISFFKNFQPEDTVELEICSVSEQYNEYLEGLKNITNQEDDQFFDMSGPPANAAGNIEGTEAMGYFRVSSVVKESAVVLDGREK